MSKPRVLYVSQAITPYLPECEIASIARELPQAIQEEGKEIRLFMPRFGCINERRHQLHEVIRLSGMNLVVNDFDHPLIIKVASIQPARMQVYFIDNEEYFHRKAALEDKRGKAFKDNDERSIFFVKGVLEAVKKLGWSPDLIHCHGWMAAALPAYLRTVYADDPLFAETRTVYSAYNDSPKGKLDKQMKAKMEFDGVPADKLEMIETPDYNNLHKLAISHADGVIFGEELDQDVVDFAKGREILTLKHEEEGYVKAYNEMYDKILEESSVLAQ